MTLERLDEIIRTLITCDGQGCEVKGAALRELLASTPHSRDRLASGEQASDAFIREAINGSCLLCSSRNHRTRECPQRKVRTC